MRCAGLQYVLSPSGLPGQCLALNGTSGHVDIRLRTAITPQVAPPFMAAAVQTTTTCSPVTRLRVCIAQRSVFSRVRRQAYAKLALLSPRGIHVQAGRAPSLVQMHAILVSA